MARNALIVHPGLGFQTGGDYVSILIAKSLLDQRYDVTIASETLDIDEGERVWKGGDVLKQCGWLQLPKPRWNRLKSLQRLLNVDELVGQTPDIVFEAQKSTYALPDRKTVSIVYHPGDLLYYWGNGWLSKREMYYRLIRGVKATV